MHSTGVEPVTIGSEVRHGLEDVGTILKWLNDAAGVGGLVSE